MHELCITFYEISQERVLAQMFKKSKDGQSLLTEAEQSEGWIENVRDVLNQSIPSNLIDFDEEVETANGNPNIPISITTEKEVSAALKSSRTNALKTYAKKFGLRISEKKNKIQKIGCLADYCDIIVERAQLDNVNDFQYLGGMISKSGETEIFRLGLKKTAPYFLLPSVCLINKIVFNHQEIVTIYIYRSIYSIIRMRNLEKYHQNCTETSCISSE